MEVVKHFIASAEGVDASDMYMSCQGRMIETGSFESNNICDLSTVEVGVRLRGGKVHGSLARAGKVKGQTPKVEKAEGKKKSPRGRAKRRQQYIKRFVNVVAGAGGKKKGPNSNADKVGI